MESLAESMREQPAMPRLEDGSANLRELMRRIAEDVVNAIMDAEADQLCAGGANSRNGYRERNLVTCVGDITMRIPKLRSGSFFPEDVVERYQRVDRAVVSAVAEMYATGTSTRKVQRIAEKLGISRLSKDQVSAIAKDLDADIAELKGRTLPMLTLRHGRPFSQVQIDPLVEGYGVAVATGLPVAGHAGLHQQPLTLVVVVGCHLVRQRGARAHDAHPFCQDEKTRLPAEMLRLDS